jgi:hypothetical protein
MLPVSPHAVTQKAGINCGTDFRYLLALPKGIEAPNPALLEVIRVISQGSPTW